MNIKDQLDTRDKALYGKKNVENSLALLYHENSKMNVYSIIEEHETISSFNNPYIISRSSQPYKIYYTADTIDLSKFKGCEPSIDFFEVLKKRKSIRKYKSHYKISLKELYVLLQLSYGVTRKEKIINYDIDGYYGYRNVPSGGAMYPLEIYVVLFNSDQKSGLYHFNTKDISLEKMKEGQFQKELGKIVHAEPYVEMQNASAVIFTTGIIERVSLKYGERGYRLMMIEVGLLAQNISLLAEAIDLSSCMVGGYYDEKVNEFLGIDGVFETINNVFVIGKKQSTIPIVKIKKS
tara:strand:+ start:3655 stop:4533 length:879 start_codon:yes stop_codon:yes gene_type:complete